jgi:hypothetical protein
MIRDEISKIIGYKIEKGYWQAAFKKLEQSGGIPARKMLDILLLLCQKIEKMEENAQSNAL